MGFDRPQIIRQDREALGAPVEIREYRRVGGRFDFSALTDIVSQVAKSRIAGAALETTEIRDIVAVVDRAAENAVTDFLLVDLIHLVVEHALGEICEEITQPCRFAEVAARGYSIEERPSWVDQGRTLNGAQGPFP